MALCEGDERKAKYTYINLRAKELEQKANKGRGATDSVASMKTDDKGANQRPITSQLVSGDLGLAKTF